MSDRLREIAQKVSTRLAARRLELPLAEVAARAQAAAPPRSLRSALRRPSKGQPGAAPLRVIGELKRRSPSAGNMNELADPAATAVELAEAGCAALSVLTEPDYFGGSLDTLDAVRSAVDLPLLRKDFIVDPYQIVEARAHGADAVLLLAALLDDLQLDAFRERAGELGMDVLAEAHGPQELDRLLGLEMPIVGLNARDLSTFEVDLDEALRWCERVPVDRIAVAESGVRTREDGKKVWASAADAALVGEGLMRGGDPSVRFAELFGGGDR